MSEMKGDNISLYSAMWKQVFAEIITGISRKLLRVWGTPVRAYKGNMILQTHQLEKGEEKKVLIVTDILQICMTQVFKAWLPGTER